MTPTEVFGKPTTSVVLFGSILAFAMFCLIAFLAFLAITQERTPFIIGEPYEKSSTKTAEYREYRDTRDSNVRILPKDKGPTPVD